MGGVEGMWGGKKRSGGGCNKEDGADRRGGWERIDERRGENGDMNDREREGKKMKCMLFPGSIINTVINERGDQGSAPYIRSSSYRRRGE